MLTPTGVPERVTPSSNVPRKSLSVTDASLIIAGIVIGPGIFETASTVAGALPNPTSLLLMWLLGGVLSLAGALCYVELAGRYTRNGGEYIWLQEAYGTRIADLFLWSDIAIVRPGAIAAMAFPAAHHCKSVIPALPWSDTILAVTFIVLFTVINIAGFHLGTITQNLLTILTCACLAFIIGLGLLAAAPISPHTEVLAIPHSPDYGLALMLVLFAYGGWNEIANVTADTTGGSRGLYRASLISLAFITTLYILLQHVFLQALGFQQYSTGRSPFVQILESFFPSTATATISAVICLSCLGTIQGMIFTGARLYQYVRIERDLSNTQRDTSHLTVAYLMQGFIALSVTALTASFMDAVVYTTAVAWIFFLLKGLAVPVLRFTRGKPADASVPWYPLPVIVFCGSSAYVVYSAILYSPRGSVISIALVLIGLAASPLAKAITFLRNRG